jgi:hypothetical protein
MFNQQCELYEKSGCLWKWPVSAKSQLEPFIHDDVVASDAVFDVKASFNTDVFHAFDMISIAFCVMTDVYLS